MTRLGECHPNCLTIILELNTNGLPCPNQMADLEIRKFQMRLAR
jgi:hypothetical protein